MFSFFVYFTFIFTRLWLITLKTLWTQSFVDVLKCSVKTGVLKKFANFICFTCFTCWSLFLIKLQALSSATLLVRDSNTVWRTTTSDCFYSEKFCKFQRKTPASLFKNVAGLKDCNFIKSKLSSTGIFLWNLQNF